MADTRKVAISCLVEPRHVEYLRRRAPDGNLSQALRALLDECAAHEGEARPPRVREVRQ